MGPALAAILITGCSSGFDFEIARYFTRSRLASRRHDAHAARGRPAPSERLRVLPLDVTDLAEMTSGSGQVTHAKDVAEATWRAVTDPASPLRIPAGADTIALLEASRS